MISVSVTYFVVEKRQNVIASKLYIKKKKKNESNLCALKKISAPVHIDATNIFKGLH